MATLAVPAPARMNVVPATPSRGWLAPPLRTGAGPGFRRDARWPDAARSIAGLWLLVLLLYLPDIVARHRGTSMVGALLDGSTVFVSMLLAAFVFRCFRATLASGLVVRVAVMGLAVALAAAGQAGYDLLLVRWLSHHPGSGWPAMRADLARGPAGMFNDAAVFAVNVALFQLAFQRRRGRRQERQLAAARTARQRSELDALRFKLNPHFLFNTLNGISAMIVTKRLAEADEMVDRLSSFLRTSLAGDSAAPITIEREFRVIEHYARIEELRFGERLAVELHCADEVCDRTVPPLLIQQLVEHVIEVASRAHATTRITVSAERAQGQLCITITHPHMDMAERHLAAARERLAGMAGASVLSVPGATRLRLAPAGTHGAYVDGDGI